MLRVRALLMCACMRKGHSDGAVQQFAGDFPSVAIRCPECGAFLRELAHAAGSFTVVACGPCGESFRLTTSWHEWPAEPGEDLSCASVRAPIAGPKKKQG